ncbi:S-adenosyl-L-methionine-dependent methyltransferase [Meira miltonrushii]|uniref:phosphoethanolamine N-methyltransferase n=1 Tax=Meira miltonrushii TaxID=1280837 RepID=A0A316V8X5_9BASI|nr:S-adenosyl-L-methionine-dependent methyltransferase [Meira miltonrushii]PWN33488.1 S-adenosyl-L-methionine-dependent methyltransferase [Meira miltonrushii]
MTGSIMGSILEIAFTILQQLVLLPLTLLSFFTNQNSKNEESYSSFDHLALNVKRPQTEWLNMGDWTDVQDDLPMACRQLCERLYSEADIRPGAKILDVGHGCGDSLLLLMQRYRPRILHGVTSLPSHAQRARKRVQDAQRSTNGKAQEMEVEVHCDDAVAHVERLAELAQKKQTNGKTSSRLQPLDGTEGEEKYDFIFALDCAYHFKTRQRFINACHSLLKPGGTLALVDLIATHPYPLLSPQSYNKTTSEARFSPSPSIKPPKVTKPSLLDSIKHSFVLRMVKVPSVNLISANTYLAQLDQAKYDDVLIQDISHAMFPNFARFLKRLGQGEEQAWRGGGNLQLTALRAFGHVVEGWAEGGDHGMVRSVIVVAKKE